MPDGSGVRLDSCQFSGSETERCVLIPPAREAFIHSSRPPPRLRTGDDDSTWRSVVGVVVQIIRVVHVVFQEFPRCLAGQGPEPRERAVHLSVFYGSSNSRPDGPHFRESIRVAQHDSREILESGHGLIAACGAIEASVAGVEIHHGDPGEIMLQSLDDVVV